VGSGKEPRMRGSPHGDDPKASMRVELWAWSPRAGPNDIGPMNGALRAMEPRVEN